jgi:hypothetical protein
MIRPIALSLAAGIVLFSAAAYGDVETVPVVHSEPITVRVLGSKDGRPLTRLHLVLIGGYDRNDMHDQLFRRDVLTDTQGRVRLPNQLANLPWLQVWVNKKTLCQSNPRKTSFSVELIRREGLSTPNRCGLATVEDSPGVFTVFVKDKGAIAPAKAVAVSATVIIPAAPAIVSAPDAVVPVHAMIVPQIKPAGTVAAQAQTVVPAPKSEPPVAATAPTQSGVTTSAKKPAPDAAPAPQPAPAAAPGSCDSEKKASRCVSVCEHLGSAANGVARIFH